MRDFSEICVVFFDNLGDAVLASGFVASLKRAWPRARLTVFCAQNTSAYWRICPFVDRVMIAAPLKPGERIFADEARGLPFDLVVVPRAAPDYPKAHRYVEATHAAVRLGFRQVHLANDVDSNHAFTDLVAIPQGGPDAHPARWGVHLLAALGLHTNIELPFVTYGAAAREWAARTIPDGRWAAIGLGASVDHKIWPPESFAAVMARLGATGWGAVPVAGPSERRLVERFMAAKPGKVIDLAETNIEQLAAALDRCALFIGNDSGPKHVAAALGKPVLEVCGINCDFWAMAYDVKFSAYNTAAIVVRPPRKFSRAATFSGQAIRSIGVDAVTEAAGMIIGRRTAAGLE